MGFNGLPLQKKYNGSRTSESASINPYTQKVMKRIVLISLLFALGMTYATAQEKANVKNQKDSTCIIHCNYEQMPSFPGGTQALMDYLKENTRWPGSPESCVQGRVVVSFVVEKDGSIGEPKVVKSLDPAFDAEALRVVSMMPKWIPGKFYGEATRVKYCLPIIFKLSNDEQENAKSKPPMVSSWWLMPKPAQASPTTTSLRELQKDDDQITVYDVQGNQRYSGKKAGLSLPSGTYIVKSKEESRKIVVH